MKPTKPRAVSVTAFSVLVVFVAAAVDAGSLPLPRASFRNVIVIFRHGPVPRPSGELLDNGFVRCLFTGGRPLPVLVNGRPFAGTEGMSRLMLKFRIEVGFASLERNARGVKSGKGSKTMKKYTTSAAAIANDVTLDALVSEAGTPWVPALNVSARWPGES